ncbi:MAG TPA: hypothetical protein VEB21_03020 [Terriglobales bacterium]|nr:hypothetical protein [Terriglobales bacterium]
MRASSMVASLVVLMMALPAAADLRWSGERSAARDSRPGKGIAKRLQGSGGWQRRGGAKHSGQRWRLDVQRDAEDRLSGRVQLGRSPLAAAGNLSGVIAGDSVQGSIADDSGNLIASFEGTIGADGIRGRYTDRTGEVGDWTWEGALPQ